MRQLTTIARNGFLELIRQPVFLLLMSCSAGFIVFLAVVPYFGFGKEPKLVKDGAMAIMLLTGLFGAVTSASSSLAQEVRSGTVLAVLSKPVNRTVFLIAKYIGVALSLVLLTYVNLLATLVASRMVYDAYGGIDIVAASVFFLAMGLSYTLAGFTNYFLRRAYIADAVMFQVVLLTLAFVWLAATAEQHNTGDGPGKIDWRLLPASILVLQSVLILAGMAMACSTRLETIPTLSICSVLFLLGLMSDYLFGHRAESGSWWAEVVYAILPNWQLFWMADALEGTKPIDGIWLYVGKSLGYVIGYLGAMLTLALCLFEDRELSGT